MVGRPTEKASSLVGQSKRDQVHEATTFATGAVDRCYIISLPTPYLPNLVDGSFEAPRTMTNLGPDPQPAPSTRETDNSTSESRRGHFLFPSLDLSVTLSLAAST